MAPTPPIIRQRPGKPGALLDSRRQAWFLLAPALAVLAVLTVYPSIYVLWLSLHDYVPIFGVWRFSGLRHFLFAPTDTRFVSAAGTTVMFTIASVALETMLGVAVAVALAGQRRGRHLAFSLLLLAWAMPAVVTARMFEWLYHPAAGLLNYLFGISVNWLGDTATALPAVILADVWRTMPFIAVLAYARLLGIPPELYEAAHVDGATLWQRFRHVTMPLLSSFTLPLVVASFAYNFTNFGAIYLLTRGNPVRIDTQWAGNTDILITVAYKLLGQPLYRYGLASAMALVLFLVVGSMALAQIRALRLVDDRR
jgi:multiple sugar transport system permease protein